MKKKAKKAKKVLLKFYKSIDELTIDRWFKIDEKNDLSHLLIGKERKLKPHEIKILEVVWDNMLCEFVDEFGISEKMKNINTCRKKIILFEIKQATTGENQQTFINVERKKLENLTKEEVKQSNSKSIADIAKYMGFRLNTKEVTVKEYFSYVNKLNEESKQYEKNEFSR